MFGLSFGKLLVLVAMIVAAWYGVRYIQRLQKRADRAERARDEPTRTRAAPPPQQLPTEDLVKCPTCGTYVPVRHAGRCGRADCPYG